MARRRFSDLLTVGGRLYHETHFAPMLRMQGQVREIALELVARDGHRLPVLVTSSVRTTPDGEPLSVRTTVFDARERRAYEQELLRGREAVERERVRLHRLATTLQRTLLPPVLPYVPGLRVAAHYHPASVEEVGGDFYDLFPLSADRWGFFLGDVCGKGAGAAAVTSLSRYALRTAAVGEPDPRAVLATLNTVLLQENQADDPRFCTVVFGVLAPDGDSFTITVASGGHPPATVLRADGTAERLHTPQGQLVGILPNAVFTAATTRLRPGDVLLLYTDGLSEARTPGGGLLGDEPVVRLAADPTRGDAQSVVDTLADLVATLGDGLADDIALLAISM